MKKIFLGIFLVLIITNLAIGQDSFTNSVSTINKELKDVKLKNSITKQTIKADNKGSIVYKRAEEKKNGKKYDLEYNFSIQDINPLSIRHYTDRDLLYVTFSTLGNSLFIKYSKDNNFVKYENSVSIFAENIENAENIISFLKNTVAEGEKLKTNKKYPQTYNECVEWLQKNIENNSKGNFQYSQQIEKIEGKVSSLKISANITNRKKSNIYSYYVNFADIDPYTVKVDIKNEKLRLIGNVIHKLNYIKIEKPDKVYFSSGFDLYFDNLETARDYVKVIQILIPLAKKRYEESLPTQKNIEAAFPQVNNKIKNVTTTQNNINQSFTIDCITTFSQTHTSPNKKEKYTLNLADLPDKLAPIVVSNSSISLNISTENKTRFIKQKTDDVFKAYINNFSIFFDDIDVGRESLILIENSIKYCKDNKPNIGISGSTAEKQKWLIDKIQTVEFAQMKIEQKLRSTPNSKMLNYTIIEASPKKTTELIYDFKWEDMDANSVEFSILPQSLGIYVNTKNYAKVINFSKNGVVQNYTHRIYFEFSDVETCKKAFYVIQDLIKASQK